MTPGECDASYRGTQIGGDLHDTSAIPDGYTRRKDNSILRRSAVCDEISILAEMNCTAVELNDMTFLRQRLPRRQDSAEYDECYISVSVIRLLFFWMWIIRQLNYMTWFSAGGDCRGEKWLPKVWRESVFHQGQILWQPNRII